VVKRLSATFVGRLGRGQQSFVSSSVDVQVVGYTASLGACPLNLRLGPGPRLRACLAYGAGWLEVESELERGRLQRTSWSSPEASVRLGFVSSWWTVEIGSGVRQHLTRPQYFATVDGSRIPLYRVPRWGFLAGISWAVRAS
jgi:hypothetical protein